MSDNIIVSGYAQRVFYPSGVEYRNYAADLVGNQSATGNSIFTSNNFVVTTNINPKSNLVYNTDKFSNFFTQNTLSIDSTIQTLTNADVTLNIDPSRLDSYAYYGSLKEFVRVSLETIITNWPASLYITNIQPLDGSTTGNTVTNYTYNPITNQSTFNVDTDFIINNYSINYLISGVDIEDNSKPLKTIASSYTEYVIDNDLGVFPVLGFTGATNLLGDSLTFTVKGQAFTGGTDSVEVFHIRPNNIEKEKFFKSLNGFENYILNRQSLPIYSAEFTYPNKTDLGVLLYQSEKLTWPITDGYNLDFMSQPYIDYASRLVEISEGFDNNKTDLIHRYLTAESISSFDTAEDDGDGMKITKLLRVMGRNFDDIKQYIDGIAFGNQITYNKKDNVPDDLVKVLARSMGWQTTASLIDNDVINYFLTPSDSTYEGQSVGMTTAESEVELWRRLIMNSPWLFKSKGTRKAIEFLLGFIGTPNGLIEFKEYIYKADKPVDVELIKEIYEELNIPLDYNQVWFDSDGYPKTVRNTPNMYFQKGGLWYRETAGQNAHTYISEGNNPHIGPYNGGKEYLSNFSCLIPDFNPLTIVKDTITNEDTKLYVNYNDGRINACTTGSTIDNYFTTLMPDNSNGEQCYETLVEKIVDPYPTVELTDCDCPVEDCDESIKISITKKDDSFIIGDTCGYDSFELLATGGVSFTTDNVSTLNISEDCCSAIGFTPYGYSNLVQESTFYNSTLAINKLENGMIYQLIESGGVTLGVNIFDGDAKVLSLQTLITITENIFNENELAKTSGDVTALNTLLQNQGLNTNIPLSICNWN